MIWVVLFAGTSISIAFILLAIFGVLTSPHLQRVMVDHFPVTGGLPAALLAAATCIVIKIKIDPIEFG
jgi:hypothetical protein